MIGVWKSHARVDDTTVSPLSRWIRFNLKIIIEKKEQNFHLCINLNKRRKETETLIKIWKKNVYFVDKKRRTHLKGIIQEYDNSSRIHYGIVYTRKNNDETRWCLECTVSLASMRIVFHACIVQLLFSRSK